MAGKEVAPIGQEIVDADIVEDAPASASQFGIRYLGSQIVDMYGDVSLVRHRFRMNLGAAQVELTPPPIERSAQLPEIESQQ